MGVVALMTAAMLLGTVRSPMAKKTNGMALLKRATRSSQPRSRRGGRERRRARSTVQRKAAPKAVRMSATQGGGKLWTVRLMSRNDAPQKRYAHTHTAHRRAGNRRDSAANSSASARAPTVVRAIDTKVIGP